MQGLKIIPFGPFHLLITINDPRSKPFCDRQTHKLLIFESASYFDQSVGEWTQCAIDLQFNLNYKLVSSRPFLKSTSKNYACNGDQENLSCAGWLGVLPPAIYSIIQIQKITKWNQNALNSRIIRLTQAIPKWSYSKNSYLTRHISYPMYQMDINAKTYMVIPIVLPFFWKVILTKNYSG